MKRALIILLVVAVLVGVGLFVRNSGTFSFNANSKDEGLSEEQVATIVEQVGRHIRIPEEVPVVATITDIDALVAVQAFYQGAKNGDYLLIFPTAARAIIYDAGADVLVNVGPVILDETAQPTAETTSPETPSEEEVVEE